jgi:hypothetical protein
MRAVHLHALNLRLERRFYQGFSVLMNYTYSKLMDDVGSADGQGDKTVQSVDSSERRGIEPARSEA